MVFDGSGPLVKRCDGFDGSLWSKSNDAAERLLHHDDIATGRKLSNFNIPSIKMEAYIAAILNSIKDGQDIKQVPPAAFFNRTEEEVIANMEESRELDEQ